MEAVCSAGLHNQLHDHLYDQLHDKLDDELHDQLDSELHDQVDDQLHDQVDDQLHDAGVASACQQVRGAGAVPDRAASGAAHAGSCLCCQCCAASQIQTGKSAKPFAQWTSLQALAHMNVQLQEACAEDAVIKSTASRLFDTYCFLFPATCNGVAARSMHC